MTRWKLNLKFEDVSHSGHKHQAVTAWLVGIPLIDDNDGCVLYLLIKVNAPEGKKITV